MRVWTLVGILLALIGVVLFLNGVRDRFASQPVADKSEVKSEALQPPKSLPSDSAPAPRPQLEAIDTATTGAVESPKIGIEPKVSKALPAPPPREKPEQTIQQTEYPFSGTVSNDPDGRKNALISSLKKSGWSAGEIGQLGMLLDDPRVGFRDEILVRNSTFEETAEQYQHNFKPEAIDRCLQFYQNQEPALKSASSLEGVPPEILVAILKVETNLGAWLGKESVFNVFWTLSLGDHPEVQKALLTKNADEVAEMKKRMVRRAGWAKGQLRDLLYVARHGGEDPVGIMGSFAGAFGLPQFIPSSYRAFGRDGDGNGVIDLDNIADATASIAYYLKENGWSNSADRARKKKVILTYNHSSFYADCVLTLADSIAARASVLEVNN